MSLQVQGQNASGSYLDRVLGTANSGLDLWQRWQGVKLENLQTRAEIPSTVVQPSVTGATLSQKTILGIVGGVIAAAVLALFLRKR